ncbi:MAG: hypothetical protein ABI970_23825 [Chloroflexota bacterium]
MRPACAVPGTADKERRWRTFSASCYAVEENGWLVITVMVKFF